MVTVTASPLLGGLLGALLSLGLIVIAAAWTGQLGRSATRTRRPLRVDHFTLRVALAATGVGLAYWWSGWIALMASLGVLGWMIPSFVGLRTRRRQQLARSEAIAIWAEMLRDLLVSNAGLHEAIGKSARVAPAAIRDEVRALYVRSQRGDLSSALARFADDMDDSIADTVAMQLRVNAARARTYRTAQLIAGIVVFFVGVMIVTNRDYMDPFGTFVGQLVLTAVAVIVAAAVWGMIVLSRPAVPARLLKVAVRPQPVPARP